MSIGINLRVTGHTSIGGRKYQEDFFSVAYQQTENDQSLEYAFFGIYDGHGGAEASLYAREHLMNTIVSQKLFWSESDDDVLKAIRDGYIQTHYSMWREQDKWPKTSSGLPSTAGTTASIAFIRRGKIYIGHVGDSGIVLGYQKDKETHDGGTCTWNSTPLTEDHKPEAYAEKMRIMSCGGKVVTKSGVPRVVWNRPRIGHKGPVRRSTLIDEIPFLAVARSLGDLWSYNSAVDEFIVSPNPDVSVIEIDPKKYRCLIFGTDGLWNVISPKHAVEIVHAAEIENIRIALEGGRDWKNPSKLLVNEALERWSRSNMKADNTSVVIIMLDPPGPPKRDVLKSMRTSIQHIDHQTVSTQSLDRLNITLYDHTTRELIDLSQVTCQEAPAIGHGHTHQQQHQPYLDSATTAAAPYQDIVYADSFAESYNSFLNTSLSNDHSYKNYTSSTNQQYTVQHHHHDQQLQHHHQHQQHHGMQYVDEDRNLQEAEETYSLTNLQTKSERLQSEMMEASTSASSASLRYPPIECAGGNVAIIENFHDYQLPHMPHHSSTHQPPYSVHYPHQSSYQQHHHHHHHQHHHHEQPTYQMERYDYHHHSGQSSEQAGCSYNSPQQHYTAHDLSEHHGYQQNAPPSMHYLYPQHPENNVQQDEEAGETTEEEEEGPQAAVDCLVESSMVATSEEGNVVQRSFVISEAKPDDDDDDDDDDEEGIQINEISSSNLNVLSPVQETALQSDSDGCASGDEAKASSSTSTRGAIPVGPKAARKSATSLQAGKDKSRVRKTIKNIVKIVYETRSNQRPHRTRSQQENLSISARRTMQSKFGKLLPKNSNVKSFLTFKKMRKTASCNLGDNNNSTAKNNNINNNNVESKDTREVVQEKRVLRSADQLKHTKHENSHKPRRSIENVSLISSSSQTNVQKRSAPNAEQRKLPKRKMVLRKMTVDAKRVRR